ncbi:MAG: glycosyltransferase family 2 protein [Flavobacteriales bacterium]|nr:glycosyltransferase family 2 protein [Flavobacteriales bacterium]
MSSGVDISVVVPSYNEEESLPELQAWIDKVMQANNYSYEVIVVDDGSSDGSWKVVEELAQKHPKVKGIKFRRNYGKSAALNTAFDAAQGAVVITMDADLQDSPDEIPELYNMITKEGYDLVSGWKKHRKDSFIKNKTSKIYNFFAWITTGVKLNDMNCGLKAYRLEVVKSIEVYGEMHRYIPAIAKWAGFRKIGEKVVQHQERKYGVTKFGLERFIHGFLDLLSITFVSKFGKRPMHLFGALGTLMFAIGFMSTGWVIGQKLYYVFFLHERMTLVTEQPLFYISLVTMILGTQLFLAGFLGELLGRNSSDRNTYLIEKRINP